MANLSVLGHPEFRKLKKCNTIEEEKDRISELPDELLSNILARLTLKEAIATSILSKRWTDVWASYPVLDFGFFRNIYYPGILVHRINKIVEKYNGGKLHKFRIAHWMSQRFKSHIDEWISFATRNHVSELELDFGSWATIPPCDSDNYCVPLHVFAQEEMMIPNRSSPNVVRSFVSLRDLRLKSINFSDQVFDTILYNCSSLEIFHLKNNCGLVNAKNTAPRLKLKSLELYHCFDLEQLELLAPNLVSFKYTGRQRNLCIKDSQQLVSLSISLTTLQDDDDMEPMFLRGKNLIFNHISSYLPKLESLFLSVTVFLDMSNFKELCVFSNLKTLVLDGSSTGQCCQLAAYIIGAAPYLEILELNLKSARVSLVQMKPLELPSMSTHKNLKEVKVYGFKPDVNAMDFLGYLINLNSNVQLIIPD